jgi:hypothetical protein
LPAVNWTHRTPAGLPSGIPGIADEIDGAMQHAPQPTRHSICLIPFLDGFPPVRRTLPLPAPITLRPVPPLPAAHAAANAFSSRVAEAAAGDRSPPRKIL